MFAQITLDTQVKVTPQMVIASNLLRLSATDVEDMIARELAENPALEINEDRAQAAPKLTRSQMPPAEPAPSFSGGSLLSGAKKRARPAEGDEFDPLERVAAHESLTDQLLAQAGLLVSGREFEIAAYLIQCLDSHGFLDAKAEVYARELGVNQDLVERVIVKLHELQPPGIAARDTRECFLIQCRQLAAEGVECGDVCLIVDKAWKDFINQRWDSVARKVKLSRRAVERAWQFMRLNLYPYPLQMMAEPDARGNILTRADLIVRREPGTGKAQYALEIPDADAFELRVNPSFQQILTPETTGTCALPTKQREWINDAVSRARMVIAALNQRWVTLRRIGEFLMEYQRPFLEEGARGLKPLTRYELSQELGVHESTISRAIADKTMMLPNGRIIPLGDLFDNSLCAKEAIRQIIVRSDKALSDREIALLLRPEGHALARRTVTKYREAMGIPTKQQRRRSARLRLPAASAD